MRIDHIDITVPTGTFNESFFGDLDKLLTHILGRPGETRRLNSPLDGSFRQERVYWLPNGDPFLVLREAHEALQPGFEDHIGVMVEPSELDRVFDQCQQLAAIDDRVEVGWTVDDLPLAVDVGTVVLRGFFVRYLLPLWLDIQTRDIRSGKRVP